METSPTGHPRPFIAALAACAWCALAVALGDVLLATLLDRATFIRSLALLESIAAVFAVAVPLHLAVTLALQSRLRNVVRASWTAAIALATFGLVFAAAAPPPLVSNEIGLPGLRIGAGVLLATLLATLSGYGASRVSPDRWNTQTVRAGLLALPVLAITLLLWAWSGIIADGMGLPLPNITLLLWTLLVLAAFAIAGMAAFRIDRFVLLALVLACLGAPFAAHVAGRAPAIQTQAVSGPKHVYLIVVDTLRADALSYAGSETNQTPHLDALAADSVVFSNAMSQAPWTMPAMTSMLTGLSPLVHRAVHRESQAVPSLTTLAEHFQGAGYNTVAIGKNPIIGPHAGLHQGFDRVQWFPRPTGGRTLGRALIRLWTVGAFATVEGFDDQTTTDDLIDRANETSDAFGSAPTFTWLHIFDPHLPYAPPRAYLNGQSPPPGRTQFELGFDDLSDIRRGVYTPTIPEQIWIRTLYEAEIRYVDAAIGRFVAHLKDTGRYDDALIVVTSDHGEEFWDHGGFEHGHSLYRELLHVPLVIKLPGGTCAQWSGAPVSTTAITPTLLDLCGIESDTAGYSSPSLAAYWDESPAPLEQPVYATGLLYYFDREALIADGLKYIHTFEGGYRELYDIAADPKEYANILGTRAGDAEAAAQRIAQQKAAADALRQHLGLDANNTPAKPLNTEAERALDSVGYL